LSATTGADVENVFRADQPVCWIVTEEMLEIGLIEISFATVRSASLGLRFLDRSGIIPRGRRPRLLRGQAELLLRMHMGEAR